MLETLATITLVVASAIASTTADSQMATRVAPSAELRESSWQQLQAVFGPAANTGFGSATFQRRGVGADGLEAAALGVYQEFLGPNWDRFGESAWKEGWRRLHLGAPSATEGVVALLARLSSESPDSSTTMIIEAHSQPDSARSALAGTFDAASIRQLAVYAIGDGAAMSGCLIAATDATGDAVFVAFLMD